jgi:hypothetical protein
MIRCSYRYSLELLSSFFKTDIFLLNVFTEVRVFLFLMRVINHFVFEQTNILDSSSPPPLTEHHQETSHNKSSTKSDLPLADTENPLANKSEALQKQGLKESMRSFTRSQRDKDDMTAAPKCEACSCLIER